MCSNDYTGHTYHELITTLNSLQFVPHETTLLNMVKKRAMKFQD